MLIAPTLPPRDRCDLTTHHHVWRFSMSRYGRIRCLCERQTALRDNDGRLRVSINGARDKSTA